MLVVALRNYYYKYMMPGTDYITSVRENYATHYKAARRRPWLRLSVERMEFVINETIKQRMLKS